MSHRVTLVCDSCEQNFMLEEEQELPPYWIGLHLILSDGEGIVPSNERDEVFFHFCSQKCAAKYVGGEEVKRRIKLIDQEMEEYREEQGDADFHPDQ